MKYIRTKWSIFEVVEETDLVYRVKAKWTPTHIYSKSKCQTEVIKQADTIEELCDEFVIFNPTIEQKEYLVKWLGKDKIKYKTGQQQEGFITPYETLYGAIWTDWGLKYVAKMNEKGELELL